MITSRFTPRAVLVLLMLAPAGCGRHGPPGPVDSGRAREALRTALEAWKEGQEPASLRTSRPPIHVSDHNWAAGASLADYEVLSEQARAAELHCQVRLTFRDSRGRPHTLLAIYDVGTQPALTVLRADDES